MLAKIYVAAAFVIDVLLSIYLDFFNLPLRIFVFVLLLPILFFILFGIQIIICYIISLFVNKSKPVKKPSKFFRIILDKTIELVLFILRYKVISVNKQIVPKDRRFLLVSNHISAFDPISTLADLQKYGIMFVSKPENFKIPAAGGFMHKCGFLPIDRNNPRSSMRTLHKCVDIIKTDIASVGIYPEGHRSPDGKLQEFKDGVFYVAKKADCPIVVMTVRYEKPKFKLYPFNVTKVFLEYKALIEPESFAEKTTHLISDEVYKIMTK